MVQIGIGQQNSGQSGSAHCVRWRMIVKRSNLSGKIGWGIDDKPADRIGADGYTGLHSRLGHGGPTACRLTNLAEAIPLRKTSSCGGAQYAYFHILAGLYA